MRAGEERAGVTFQIRPVLTRRISGQVIADGKPHPDQLVRLLDQGAGIGTLGSEVAMTVSGRDGLFTFVHVPQGRYIVEVRDAAYVGRSIASGRAQQVLPNAVCESSDAPSPEDPKLESEMEPY